MSYSQGICSNNLLPLLLCKGVRMSSCPVLFHEKTNKSHTLVFEKCACVCTHIQTKTKKWSSLFYLPKIKFSSSHHSPRFMKSKSDTLGPLAWSFPFWNHMHPTPTPVPSPLVMGATDPSAAGVTDFPFLNAELRSTGLSSQVQSFLPSFCSF